MTGFSNMESSDFGGLRSVEAVMEVILAVAAAGFTIVIWLSSGAGGVALQESIRASAMEQSAGVAHQHVTLQRVDVTGNPSRR